MLHLLVLFVCTGILISETSVLETKKCKSFVKSSSQQRLQRVIVASVIA